MLNRRTNGWRDVQYHRGVKLLVEYVPDDDDYWAFSFDVFNHNREIAWAIADTFVGAWDLLMEATAATGIWRRR